MNTKDLLKQALHAQMAGDQQGFANAMKQVVSAKTSKLVLEMSGDISGQTAPKEGEYHVDLEEYDYNGTLVHAGLSIDIGHYAPATQGNYSARASDPSEYYGDDEEIEWHVVSARLIYEDGREEILDGEAAAALEFNDSEHETITQRVMEQMESKRDDDIDYDRGGYDY